MTWSAPRTWVDGEVSTAAMFNAHVRDNLSVLKTTRDSAGRVHGLSAAVLASLSAANVTGLAVLSSGNAYTAGRTRFLSTSRVRVPVGANKYEDLGGGLKRGVWVEGDYVHHVASNQATEYRYLGEYRSTPGAPAAGSVWVEGDYFHYVDADGDERRCLSYGAPSPHADAGAVGGSAWVETWLHWVTELGTTEKPGHADAAHVDAPWYSDSHSDVPHDDAHGDNGHADSHGDTIHKDSHGDTHEDWHSDTWDPFVDEHGDEHQDFHSDAHTDTHTDTAHNDWHADNHSDQHWDHDDHGDAAHYDQPTVAP